MNIDYLFLIPLALIYILLYWLVIPRITGKWVKRIVAVLLVPIAYFLTGYVDSYLPRLLYNVSRWFSGF